MITVYRFASEQFSHDLSGTGAGLFGGRWNPIGIPAVYTSFTISLALVELFIHKQTYEDISVNHLMEITIDAPIDIHIDYKKLKKGWQNDASYCQFMGNQFLNTANSVAISVPSAIIQEENNLVLNPQSRDFIKKVKLKKVRPFYFDHRLFK